MCVYIMCVPVSHVCVYSMTLPGVCVHVDTMYMPGAHVYMYTMNVPGAHVCVCTMCVPHSHVCVYAVCVPGTFGVRRGVLEWFSDPPCSRSLQEQVLSCWSSLTLCHHFLKVLILET